MNSSLFNVFGPSNLSNKGNILQVLQDFNNFQQTFSGNPQAEVQSLLNSGRMTQEQFNNLSQLANQIRPLIGR